MRLGLAAGGLPPTCREWCGFALLLWCACCFTAGIPVQRSHSGTRQLHGTAAACKQAVTCQPCAAELLRTLSPSTLAGRWALTSRLGALGGVLHCS